MIALQDKFRAGSIFGAWADLLHTGDAYSAAEKQRRKGCRPDRSGISHPFGAG